MSWSEVLAFVRIHPSNAGGPTTGRRAFRMTQLDLFAKTQPKAKRPRATDRALPATLAEKNALHRKIENSMRFKDLCAHARGEVFAFKVGQA